MIYGAGDLAEIVSHLAIVCGHQIAGYVSDFANRGDEINSLPVIHSQLIEKEFPPEEHSVILGFSGNDLQRTREERHRLLTQKGYMFPNLVHPSAQASEDFKRGYDANIVFEGAIIGYMCQLGQGNMIWQNCVLPHHNSIGSFNTFAPSVSLSGFSTIGDHCFLGNNSTVNNRIHIGDWSVLGAGSYARRSLEPKSVLVPQKSIILEEKDSQGFGL